MPSFPLALPTTLYHTTGMGGSGKQRTVGKRAQKATCSPEQADEYTAFATALKRILTVSHEEIQRKVKRASARASRAKH